jgi:hypothetical protein
MGVPELDEGSEELHGLEEVNLFEGLGAGKTTTHTSI